MDEATIIQIVLGLFGASGLVGTYIALRKLPGENSSAAVTQSQGAMDNMRVLNDQLQEDRDYWRNRAIEAEKLLKASENAAGQPETPPPAARKRR